MKDQSPTRPFIATGLRIRELRAAKGWSRRTLAAKVRVHVSSLSIWETGVRLPREEQRGRLARALGCELSALFPPRGGGAPAAVTASLVDTVEDLPALLMECTKGARVLRALRLAAPYTTSGYVQTEWRNLVADRLKSGTLRIERAEIFYTLDRLKETLSNILRYDGMPYHVKSYCAGMQEIAPFMGGYFFDEDEFILGAYWTGIPPVQQPGIRISGQPFATFFGAYWNEIWRRGQLLNIRGATDLAAVRELALALGLKPKKWSQFVDDARSLMIGDGAPPLV